MLRKISSVTWNGRNGVGAPSCLGPRLKRGRAEHIFRLGISDDETAQKGRVRFDTGLENERP